MKFFLKQYKHSGDFGSWHDEIKVEYLHGEIGVSVAHAGFSAMIILTKKDSIHLRNFLNETLLDIDNREPV